MRNKGATREINLSGAAKSNGISAGTNYPSNAPKKVIVHYILIKGVAKPKKNASFCCILFEGCFQVLECSLFSFDQPLHMPLPSFAKTLLCRNAVSVKLKEALCTNFKPMQLKQK